MRVGFFPAHPAQLRMMLALSEAKPEGVEIIWFLRDKDVLIQLAEAAGIDFVVLSRAGSRLMGNALEILTVIARAWRCSHQWRLDCWLSKYGGVNLGGWLAGCPSVSFTDDDFDVVPLVPLTSFPFAKKVICPAWTRMGRWRAKLVRYNGFHELMYINPNAPHESALLRGQRGVAIIRLSGLRAHHDIGEVGIADDLLRGIVLRLEKYFEVIISSEREIPEHLAHLRMSQGPAALESLIASAALFISDSQTMTAEAAFLGVPNLRISSFVNRLSYLDVLERAGLSLGVRPTDHAAVDCAIEQLINIDRNAFRSRLREFVGGLDQPVAVFWGAILSMLGK